MYICVRLETGSRRFKDGKWERKGKDIKDMKDTYKGGREKKERDCVVWR